MLDEATDGAVFLLNSPFAPGDVWDSSRERCRRR